MLTSSNQYLRPDYLSPLPTTAVLLRAGQPLYGPKHRRCRPDEAILNTVVNAGMKGTIYDLRSTNSISQQQNKGGGTESAANYSQWKIYNRSMDDVDNQQQLLESFSKLIEDDLFSSSVEWVLTVGWFGKYSKNDDAQSEICLKRFSPDDYGRKVHK